MKTIQQFLQRPWIYLIIILIGTSLKFYKVDFHYFWFDEVAAIEHTSGFSSYETYQLIPKNEIKNITYYRNLMHLNSRNLTITSQLRRLSKMTNLNPLHYAVLVFWHRIVGDDDVDYRWFNIFIFILTLPFLFLLAKTLFKSDLSGWIAISLFAISPFFHYAVHEARYNMLLAFLLILNNYLFLKASDQNKLKWWIGYSIVGMLALYASIMSALLFIGHFVYVLIFKRKFWITYCISVLLVFLGFLPWLISIYTKRAEINTALEWHTIFATNQNFLKLILAQLSMMARSFATINYGWLSLLVRNNIEGNYIDIGANILILVIILFSIIYAIKKLPKEVSFFQVLIVLPQFLFFLISDVIRGTGCSLIQRYQLIGIIGVLLFVTFLISRKILVGRLIYSGLYTSVIILGLVSIFLMSKDRCWNLWVRMCGENIEDARLFSNSRKPLLITGCYLPVGTGIGGFMAIMNECTSDSIDIMQVYSDVTNIKEKIPENYYSEIYIVYAPDELVQNLKTQFGEQIDSLEIEGISPMWKINLNENKFLE